MLSPIVAGLSANVRAAHDRAAFVLGGATPLAAESYASELASDADREHSADRAGEK